MASGIGEFSTRHILNQKFLDGKLPQIHIILNIEHSIPNMRYSFLVKGNLFRMTEKLFFFKFLEFEGNARAKYIGHILHRRIENLLKSKSKEFIEKMSISRFRVISSRCLEENYLLCFALNHKCLAGYLQCIHQLTEFSIFFNNISESIINNNYYYYYVPSNHLIDRDFLELGANYNTIKSMMHKNSTNI